jgi:hypothetical protein
MKRATYFFFHIFVSFIKHTVITAVTAPSTKQYRNYSHHRFHKMVPRLWSETPLRYAKYTRKLDKVMFVCKQNSPKRNLMMTFCRAVPTHSVSTLRISGCSFPLSKYTFITRCRNTGTTLPLILPPMSLAIALFIQKSLNMYDTRSWYNTVKWHTECRGAVIRIPAS